MTGCIELFTFSPIEVHDEAYHQIPLNLTKADQERLFDRIVVYTRRSDGQLQIGLDRIGTDPNPVDFSLEFDRLRQPIFNTNVYRDQWLALSELAQERGETNSMYSNQIKEFVSLFG